jgi:hypothetical protein
MTRHQRAAQPLRLPREPRKRIAARPTDGRRATGSDFRNDIRE